MFNFEDKTDKPSQVYIRLGGIYENVEITDVTSEIDKNGKAYMKIFMKNDLGEVATHSEFFVNDSEWADDHMGSEGKKVTGYRTKQANRLFHIMKTVVGEEKARFDASGLTWDQMINKIVLLLKDSYKGNKYRTLFVFPKDGEFVQFPTTPLFIENMTVAKEESRLKITKYHRLVADAKATSDAQETGEVVDSIASDDLPF